MTTVLDLNMKGGAICSNLLKRNISEVNFNTFLNSAESKILTFRTLFKDASGTLDKNARFSPLFRHDSNKLSNEDMLKLLADFRK